jgi:lipoyl-dependent peroxiredoxin
MEVVGRLHKHDVSGTNVRCETSVGPREGGGFGIAVKMHVHVPKLSTADAEAVVAETHANICPYSHATRGNIDVVFEVEGGG